MKASTMPVLQKVLTYKLLVLMGCLKKPLEIGAGGSGVRESRFLKAWGR